MPRERTGSIHGTCTPGVTTGGSSNSHAGFFAEQTHPRLPTPTCLPWRTVRTRTHLIRGGCGGTRAHLQPGEDGNRPHEISDTLWRANRSCGASPLSGNRGREASPAPGVCGGTGGVRSGADGARCCDCTMRRPTRDSAAGRAYLDLQNLARNMPSDPRTVGDRVAEIAAIEDPRRWSGVSA